MVNISSSPIADEQQLVCQEISSTSEMPEPRKEVVEVFHASEDIKMPTKDGAGMILYSNGIVQSRHFASLSTVIKLSVKPGHYGCIAPRSGLTVKNFVDVGAGVEVGRDEELKVLLFNYGDTDFQVKKDDRIAQIVAERIADIEMKEVKELSETKRGTAGFGSNGIDSTTPSETTVPTEV